eukprot:5540423-Pyramimonas_sp.AAC.2
MEYTNQWRLARPNLVFNSDAEEVENRVLPKQPSGIRSLGACPGLFRKDSVLLLLGIRVEDEGAREGLACGCGDRD